MTKQCFFAFSLFIILIPTVVFSQEAEREKVKQILVLMDAVNLLQDTIRSDIKALSVREPEIAKKTKKLLDKADDAFYMEKLIDVYSGHLTNIEAEELIIFLNSSLGKKMKKFAHEPNNVGYMAYFTPEERLYLEKKPKNLSIHVFKRLSDPLFVRKANDYLLQSFKELPGKNAPYYLYIGVKSDTGEKDDVKSNKYFALFQEHLNKIEQINIANSESHKIPETRSFKIDFDKYFSKNIDYLVTILILKDDGNDINIEVRAIDILENRLGFGKKYKAGSDDLPEIIKRFSNHLKQYLDID